MVQSKRERTVAQFKAGRINILVAPMWQPVVWMSIASAMWSTTTFRTMPKSTSIALVGRGVPAGPAKRFCLSADTTSIVCAILNEEHANGSNGWKKPSLAEIDRLRKARLQQEVAQSYRPIVPPADLLDRSDAE